MQPQLYLTPKDRSRYELIDGRLDVTPFPNLPHEDLRTTLERRLDRYSEGHTEVFNRIQAPARLFVPGRSQ